MAIAVLDALARNEGGGRLDAAGQVRVVGVDAGVEDGDLHIASGQSGQVGLDGLQAQVMRCSSQAGPWDAAASAWE
ncbi:hypothetical protein ACFVZH_40435 [Streptomyces sp. NPDC059534]|uniref:hypothetical protein n=1 Tax=Streptomyces sp. NPDC059534 TaxID=3346859 RepID=UPI00367ECB40